MICELPEKFARQCVDVVVVHDQGEGKPVAHHLSVAAVVALDLLDEPDEMLAPLVEVPTGVGRGGPNLRRGSGRGGPPWPSAPQESHLAPSLPAGEATPTRRRPGPRTQNSAVEDSLGQGPRPLPSPLLHSGRPPTRFHARARRSSGLLARAGTSSGGFQPSRHERDDQISHCTGAELSISRTRRACTAPDGTT